MTNIKQRLEEMIEREARKVLRKIDGYSGTSDIYFAFEAGARTLLDDYVRMYEALEFYGNRENWSGINGNLILNQIDGDTGPYNMQRETYDIGGEVARQTLAEIKTKLGVKDE